MMKEIEINARQESNRMHHRYLGVEHYFIGMLDLSGGLLSRLLDKHGLTPDYVKDAIRRYVGRGKADRARHAGMPPTPRAAVMLNVAYELARAGERSEPDERDLLLAILEEGDNIPVRVLARLGVDSVVLARQAEKDASGVTPRPSILKIDFSPLFNPNDALSDEAVFILRRMFRSYATVRVERRLKGGYSGALVLLVTPIHDDEREDASVVVKIDTATSILDEERRYDALVRNTLPPLTARLEERTTAEYLDIAGLKYTFVANQHGESAPLRVLAQEMGVQRLSEWLKYQLFPYFGRNWWMQRKPYRFSVWEEYDWLLPPLLTLDYVSEQDLKKNGKRGAFTFNKSVRRSKAEGLEYGTLVALQNFVVYQTQSDKRQMYLTLGTTTSETAYRAYRVHVRGVDIAANGYHRREMIETLYGTVWKTRRDSLFADISALEPDFDPRAADIPFMNGVALANPALHYDKLLDTTLDGTLSHIHGDLHLGNILTGPGEIPFLIDFANTRRGHTAFDWASLEISLWAEMVVPLIKGDWASVRELGTHLFDLSHDTPQPNTSVGNAIRPIAMVREIAGECLGAPQKWEEYHAALAMAALRALTWETTMSLHARRFMLMLAALEQSLLLDSVHQGGGVPESTVGDNDTGYTRRGGRD